jgi:hypothetical protein
MSSINDFLKKFVNEYIRNTNIPDLKSLTEKYRDSNPINLDFYYQLCKEARQKGIVFLDPTDLKILIQYFQFNIELRCKS